MPEKNYQLRNFGSKWATASSRHSTAGKPNPRISTSVLVPYFTLINHALGLTSVQERSSLDQGEALSSYSRAVSSHTRFTRYYRKYLYQYWYCRCCIRTSVYRFYLLSQLTLLPLHLSWRNFPILLLHIPSSFICQKDFRAAETVLLEYLSVLLEYINL